MQAFDLCLAFTRSEEGGYTCDPHDSGNWSTGLTGVGRLIGSNMGVSAPTLISWLDRDAGSSVDSSVMRSLSETTYEAIARAHYWRSLNCDGLAGGIAMMVFDFGWNAGVGKSARLLQTCLGLRGGSVDGDIGQKTLALLLKPSWAMILNDLGQESIRQLQALCKIGQDGVAGPETSLALQQQPDLWPVAVVMKLRQDQMLLYTSSPNFGRYGRGWLARTDRRSTAALAMFQPAMTG